MINNTNSNTSNNPKKDNHYFNDRFKGIIILD